MYKIIDSAINRSRTIWMIVMFILVAGIFSYVNIPKERSPDVQIPIIYISVTHHGISPEDAERLIIKPLEEELQSIEGIKEMTSYAIESKGSVTLEFYAGFDSDKALADVREKVDLARPEMPNDSEEPIISEVNLSKFPVVNVILLSDMPERSLLRIAKKLRDEIETLSEILDVNISGDREDIVEVIIDPAFMEGYEFSITEIFDIFDRNNILIASGVIDNEVGRYNIKVPGLLEGIQDINQVPLKVSGNSVVNTGDITEIRRAFRDANGYARVNGQSAIVLEVSKRTGENIIDTINKLKELIAEKKQYLPSNLQIIYAQDESKAIFDILVDLQNNIIFAIFLVMIIIIWFVGFKTSLLVSIAIPGSFLIAIFFLNLFGFTLNIVVLFSLILSVGMLVDSAIVVCEYASTRIAAGNSAVKSYSEAAKRMAWPIIVSTLTTVIVFMPLLFWPNIIGQFMKYMPITIIATLTSSMLMALIFIPTIGATLFKKNAGFRADIQQNTAVQQ
ncbi:MAG: efflux RND transporter permease subunit, partial [Pseudomonadota bacterium]